MDAQNNGTSASSTIHLIRGPTTRLLGLTLVTLVDLLLLPLGKCPRVMAYMAGDLIMQFKCHLQILNSITNNKNIITR